MSGGSGWQESAATSGPSLRKRSEALSSVGILSRLGSGKSANHVKNPNVIASTPAARSSNRRGFRLLTWPDMASLKKICPATEHVPEKRIKQNNKNVTVPPPRERTAEQKKAPTVTRQIPSQRCCVIFSPRKAHAPIATKIWFVAARLNATIMGTNLSAAHRCRAKDFSSAAMASSSRPKACRIKAWLP